MPQSLSQVIIHLVFSTKDRNKWLDASIQPRMHAYLATICRDCDCQAYKVGGTDDHVHLAIRLSRTISQAVLVEKVKTTSSSWIKSLGAQYEPFHWQRGYGSFSVGFSQVEVLMQYIERQAEHHRVRSFQEEYREILGKYRIAYDEQYVWD